MTALAALLMASAVLAYYWRRVGGWRAMNRTRRVAWCVAAAAVIPADIPIGPWWIVAVVIYAGALVVFLAADDEHRPRRRKRGQPRRPIRQALAWGMPAARRSPA